MSTISFSVEDELKRNFVAQAKREKKSQSELFRQMCLEKKKTEDFTNTIRRLRKKYALDTEKMGIYTVDDVADLLREP